MEKKLRDAEEERDILKKALAIFSKKQDEISVYIQISLRTSRSENVPGIKSLLVI